MTNEGPVPGATSPEPSPAQSAPPALPGALTPDTAKAEIAARRFDRGYMDRYYAGDPRARAELDALYAVAHPEPDATPAATPPATRAELDALTFDRIRFPSDASDDDRAAFRTTTRDGLAAIGATHGEAAGFAMAASDVLRAPESYTPEGAERALRASWGAAYAGNLALAKAAVQRLPPHIRAHLTETPIGNHPRVMQLLADAGRRMQARR